MHTIGGNHTLCCRLGDSSGRCDRGHQPARPTRHTGRACRRCPSSSRLRAAIRRWCSMHLPPGQPGAAVRCTHTRRRLRWRWPRASMWCSPPRPGRARAWWRWRAWCSRSTTAGERCGPHRSRRSWPRSSSTSSSCWVPSRWVSPRVMPRSTLMHRCSSARPRCSPTMHSSPVPRASSASPASTSSTTTATATEDGHGRSRCSSSPVVRCCSPRPPSATWRRSSPTSASARGAMSPR